MTSGSEETGAEPTSPRQGSGVGVGAAQAAAWGFAFVLLRVFAVSGYDWNTAYLVSTTLGLDDGPALLLGSLMGNSLLTAILLIGVLPLLMAASLWGSRGHRGLFLLLSALGLVALLAVTTSFQRWWVPVATFVVFATLAVVHRLPPTNRLRRTAGTAMARVGWVIGLSTLVVAAFGQTPWVPEERIETTQGTVTAYVLSVDPGYLNVLTHDHEFVILLSSEVLSRE